MIAVEGGTIVHAGPCAQAPQARRGDLGGRTVLPGFVDTHVHIGFESGKDPVHP